MNKSIIILLYSIILFSCGNLNTRGDADFDQFTKTFVNDLWMQYPNWATGMGYHKYDSILQIPNAAKDKSDLEFAKRYLDSLEGFDFEKLTPTHQTDYLLIKNNLTATSFYANEFKSGEWDASSYNFGGTLFELTNNKEASTEQII
jgi:hypothetical protein